MKNCLTSLFIIFSAIALHSQDVIKLKSGKVIECKIDDEDSTKYYLTVITKGSKQSTFIDKSKVANVQYANTNSTQSGENASQIGQVIQSDLYKYEDGYLRPKDLQKLLLTEPSSYPYLQRHRSARFFSYMFGISGGILIGSEASNLILRRPVRWGTFGIATGLMGVGLLFENLATNNLKQAINAFNESKLNKENLGHESGLPYPSGVGVAFRF
ncbi:MAG: hypothetical protein KDC49_08745 [Saprospiraceae bacterium]|nr:hypothetical protein [Saprospiraceae bacterium]